MHPVGALYGPRGSTVNSAFGRMESSHTYVHTCKNLLPTNWGAPHLLCSRLIADWGYIIC